ncbi:MAG: YkgJ family cysteine cluster protein [Halobacteriales archaeon]|nr:YkgJ family cysteine cluster protein [Halobacteriales archaeon]
MLPMAQFTCTGCGDCCRGFAREAPEWEPETGPVLRLSSEPGLPLLSWEWQRLRRLAQQRGIAPDVQAFDGVLDEPARRIVVLSYRLAALECPFLEAKPDLEPGPRSTQWGFARGGVCGIYEHRPLACRAYPLVPLRNGIALSLHCPELLDADDARPAELDRVYGDSAASAQAFRAAPNIAVRMLHALEARGAVRIAREAGPLRDAARAWPRVDLCDLSAEHGMETWEELELRARRA